MSQHLQRGRALLRRFRDVDAWRGSFGLSSLERVADYEDMGERNPVLSVRIP